ncbi:MAG: hypothetical protein VX589_07945 [Myxococcota bacterium]|nr:hypothetical protein [Myxococcota bacterium]
MSLKTRTLSWLPTLLFSISVAVGCSEAEGPEQQAEKPGRAESIVASSTLQADRAILMQWQLVDDVRTMAEIQRRDAAGTAWLEWSLVTQTTAGDTIYTDGPLSDGWVQYRIRLTDGTSNTDWTLIEPVEVHCLGACDEPNHGAQELPSTEQDPDVVDTDPLPGQDDGPADPLASNDGGDDDPIGGDQNDMGDNPNPAVDMDFPDNMTAAELDQALEALRTRFDDVVQLTDELSQTITDVSADAETTVSSLDVASVRHENEMRLIDTAMGELTQKIQALTNGGPITSAAVDDALETVDNVDDQLTRFAEVAMDDIPAVDQAGQITDAATAGIEQSTALSDTLAQIEVAYMDLKNAADASLNVGRIAQADHDALIASVDQDIQGHTVQNDRLDSMNVQSNQAFENVDLAVQVIVNFQNDAPDLVDELQATIDEARQLLDALREQIQSGGGGMLPPPVQPNPPVANPQVGPPPRSPRGLAVKVRNDGKIGLAWTHAAPPATKFIVQRMTKSEGSWGFRTKVAEPAGGKRSHQDAAPPGFVYRYRLRAVNAGGQSDWTSWKEVNHRPPNRPGNFDGSVSGRTAKVTWRYGGPDVDTFIIERKKQRVNGQWTTPSVVARPNGSKRSKAERLTQSRKYRYRIRAKNKSGLSDWSGWTTVDLRN